MFQELFPILSTPDLPRAIRFYRDLLGCEVHYRFPADGEPAYVGMALGPSRPGIGADPPGQPQRPGGDGRFAPWVYVEDCDAAVERLRAEGVAVLAEPADQPWGERMAEVADPDGNRVIVAARG